MTGLTQLISSFRRVKGYRCPSLSVSFCLEKLKKGSFGHLALSPASPSGIRKRPSPRVSGDNFRPSVLGVPFTDTSEPLAFNLLVEVPLRRTSFIESSLIELSLLDKSRIELLLDKSRMEVLVDDLLRSRMDLAWRSRMETLLLLAAAPAPGMVICNILGEEKGGKQIISWS